MSLLKIMNSPWAIVPAKLEEIREVYLRHVRNEHLSAQEIEAKLGPLVQQTQPTSYLEVLENGVAVLTIDGIIAKKMNLFTQISGGTSTQILANEFQQALDNPQVRAILLNIDSPGGTVDGTQELARRIFAGRGQKPIVAFTDGIMASAAYWIGAAADRVVISGDTVEVGSIGVVATHVDISKREEMMGVKTTEIVAGKFKRIASSHAPLSDIGRMTIQEMVDHIYQTFVGDVAQFRGVTAEAVLADMADGRVFLGQQTLRSGLVDEQATLEDTLSALAEGREQKGGRMAKKLEPLEPTTIEELTERYPSLVAEIRTQTRQEGLEAGKEAGTKEGRTAGYQDGLTTGAERERTRIKAVRAQHLAGHEKLIEACMFDGSTTGEQAAAKVLEAERTKRGQTLEALYAEAPKPVPASEGSDAPSPSGGNEASWKAEWERNIGGVQQEFTSEAAFLAFQRADARGGIKILTKRVAERTAAPVV